MNTLFCWIIAGLCSVALQSSSLLEAQTRYVHRVNPFVGTDGHGHTFPGATTPFGMVQLSPDTRVDGWDACAGYHYSDSTILGFSHTHLSGTGVADYGDILFTPASSSTLRKSSTFKANDLALAFNHESEFASPGYYRVDFRNAGIRAEFSATPRTGIHRYTFPEDDTAVVVVNLRHGLGPDKVLESSMKVLGNRDIEGYRRSEGWAKDQRIYFHARFSRPIISYRAILHDSMVAAGKEWSGENLRVAFSFSPSNEPLVVNVALSAVDAEGALRNLVAEVAGLDFDGVRKKAELGWDSELGRIGVEGGSPEQLVTFYTALYHAMIAPNIFSDVDGQYRGMNGIIRTANGFDMYTVFSLWDTFRAEHPLLTIIDRKRTLDFVKSLLAKYEESGVLPVWELAANETWCMIGYHAVPVIVDAYMKGIRDFDAEKAFTAMKHSAMLDHFGLAAYRISGFIPGDAEGESVSKTLEYAYDDWCIARMAEQLGRVDDELLFDTRARSFGNLFDPGTHFLRPKINGAWVKPFDPLAVTMHYTEANAWQYRFFAPHATGTLIGLMGGKKAMSLKLDSLFSISSQMTGRVQSDISGMIGQYAQGNEPSHHLAYLYNYAGEPWKTQRLVRMIMDSLYSSSPDGLCGNDDCGQMSAWYVFNAIGLYPMTPGMPAYDIGSPIFTTTSIHLENGKNFSIRAPDTSPTHRFVTSVMYNGLNHPSLQIRHEDIMNGGVLDLTMSPEPTAATFPGIVAEVDTALPGIVMVPFVIADHSVFADSIVVGLACPTPGAMIRFTLNGEDPSVSGEEYAVPLTLTSSTILRAAGTRSGMTRSPIMTARFIKHIPVGNVSLASAYSSQYTGGGDQALVDGQMGGVDFRLGAWQGYEGIDLDAVIDLGSVREVDEISLSCLQDNNSWIFFPEHVEFSFSIDGTHYADPVMVGNSVPSSDMTISRREFGKEFEDRDARYVRVVAKNIGTCPPGHKGAGGKAWIFVDEIVIR